MKKNELNFLSQFGNIKFGEENNLYMIDYEHSLKKYFKEKKPKYRDYFENVKFAEIDNISLRDFYPFLIKF